MLGRWSLPDLRSSRDDAVMGFSLEPSAPVQKEIRRVTRERLDTALERLESLDGGSAADIEAAVHDVRKRSKEVRAVARLVRDVIGDEFEPFNSLVREAAAELSSIRDAHAVLATLDDLRVAQRQERDKSINRVRSAQSELAITATSAIRTGDARIGRSTDLLRAARQRIRKWDIPEDSVWLSTGLHATYRGGRRNLARAAKRPTDERMHEWRKSVKRLWYQLRLVEAAAPSMISPLIDQLDDLAEALGDDHDLCVLIERVDADRSAFGGKKPAKRTIEIARAQQADLRRRAFRLGSTLYFEPTPAFVDRITGYWDLTRLAGPELVTGGIAELVADEARRSPGSRAAPASSIERERKFVVADLPALPDEGTRFRQGYIAIDGKVSVRVRDASAQGCTLTVKAGRGSARTELEWPLSDEQFELAWAHTAGRRVHKTRYRIAIVGADSVAELDVFHDELDDLMLVEVEFANDDELAGFEPPAWFGTEVTDDDSYSNAVLAVRGHP